MNEGFRKNLLYQIHDGSQNETKCCDIFYPTDWQRRFCQTINMMWLDVVLLAVRVASHEHWCPLWLGHDLYKTFGDRDNDAIF